MCRSRRPLVSSSASLAATTATGGAMECANGLRPQGHLSTHVTALAYCGNAACIEGDPGRIWYSCYGAVPSAGMAKDSKDEQDRLLKALNMQHTLEQAGITRSAPLTPIRSVKAVSNNARRASSAANSAPRSPSHPTTLLSPVVERKPVVPVAAAGRPGERAVVVNSTAASKVPSFVGSAAINPMGPNDWPCMKARAVLRQHE
jgi:hypothetical protein